MNNTTERAHQVVVVWPEPPPGMKTETNYRPLVSVMFVIKITFIGLWSSKKRPWQGGKNREAALKSFDLITVPFVIIENLTGILSLSFELLRIPPLVGCGHRCELHDNGGRPRRACRGSGIEPVRREG